MAKLTISREQLSQHGRQTGGNRVADEGVYKFEVKKVEKRTTQAGKEYISLQSRIMEDENGDMKYANLWVFESFFVNAINAKNPELPSYPLVKFFQFLDAIGFDTDIDTDELDNSDFNKMVGELFTAEIEVKEKFNKPGEMENKFKYFLCGADAESVDYSDIQNDAPFGDISDSDLPF